VRTAKEAHRNYMRAFVNDNGSGGSFWRAMAAVWQQWGSSGAAVGQQCGHSNSSSSGRTTADCRGSGCRTCRGERRGRCRGGVKGGKKQGSEWRRAQDGQQVSAAVEEARFEVGSSSNCSSNCSSSTCGQQQRYLSRQLGGSVKAVMAVALDTG
jgi:hypothetical protein